MAHGATYDAGQLWNCMALIYCVWMMVPMKSDLVIRYVKGHDKSAKQSDRGGRGGAQGNSLNYRYRFKCIGVP
jgi:hypothetical protein